MTGSGRSGSWGMSLVSGNVGSGRLRVQLLSYSDVADRDSERC